MSWPPPHGGLSVSPGLVPFPAPDGMRNRHARPPNAVASSSRPRKRSREKADPARPPRLSRGWVREGFRQFGEHCARNQIRTLLIDCIVMTNLLYPSLALYLQKRFPSSPTTNDRRREHDLSFLSRPLSQTFFPRPPPLLPNLDWGGWWGRDTGQSDVTWVAAPAPAGHAADGEDIVWARVAWADVRDVLERDRRAWNEQDRRLFNEVAAAAEEWDGPGRCVRHWERREGGAARQDGHCFVVSPDDVDMAAPLASLSGLAAPDDVYRSLAVPFRVAANARADFEAAWRARLEALASAHDGVVSVEQSDAYSDTDTGDWSVSLSTRSEPAPARASAYPPRLVLVLYAVLVLALLAQLSNATKVHSRFGLAFTGVVQLCCSAVMSFSVLALLGWNGWGWSLKENVLPTYVLPFVIVVVGAENMSTLTKAVFSVPFSYAVPVRIGIGLSKVGTTIAVTSLTDLALMLAVWLLVDLKPVREFCLFSAVVLITDWFMLHTFFLTVLSIDAQRLEMADLIAAGGAVEVDKKDGTRRPATPVKRFSWRNVLRARTAKSGSLILMLTCVGLLYYHNERDKPTGLEALYGYTPSSTQQALPTLVPGAAVVSTAKQLDALSPAEQFWAAVNPFGDSAVRAHVPPALLLLLPHAGNRLTPTAMLHLAPPSRLSLVRIKPALNIIKIFVVPQAISALLLYVLLLYLLKDADLLDAQRNRLGRGEVAHSDDETDDGARASGRANAQARAAAAHILPCSHECDVELIACSADGSTMLTVASDDSVCLWRFVDEAKGTREMLASAGLEASIAAAAVSADGSAVAIVTADGRGQMWAVPERDGATMSADFRTQLGGARIAAVAFDEGPVPVDDPFGPPASSRATDRRVLLATLSDGAIISIDASGDAFDIVPAQAGPGGPGHSRMLSLRDELILLSATSTSATIWRRSTTWTPLPLTSSIDATGIASAYAVSRVQIGRQACDVLVAGYPSGLVEIFDMDTGAALLTLGQAGQPIKSVGIASSPTRCATCAHPSDGLFVLTSTETATFVDRLLPRTEVLCRCAAARRPSGALAGAGAIDEAQQARIRQGAGPLVLAPSPARARPSPGGSPRKSPGLLPPVTNGDFPLSSHGSRRLSGWGQDRDRERGAAGVDERDRTSPLGRRASHSALALTPSSAASQDAPPPAPSSAGASAGASAAAAPAWADLEIVPLGAVAADAAAVLGPAGPVLGLGRAGAGVGDAAWRVWTLDLARAWNGAGLVVESARLPALARGLGGTAPASSLPAESRAAPRSLDGGGAAAADGPDDEPADERRRRRLLDLDGRAAFPSRTRSRAVPTHAAVAYTQLGPLAARPAPPAARAAAHLVVGLGNRVAVVVAEPARQGQPGGARASALGVPAALGTRRNTGPPPPPRRDDKKLV